MVKNIALITIEDITFQELIFFLKSQSLFSSLSSHNEDEEYIEYLVNNGLFITVQNYTKELNFTHTFFEKTGIEEEGYSFFKNHYKPEKNYIQLKIDINFSSEKEFNEEQKKSYNLCEDIAEYFNTKVYIDFENTICIKGNKSNRFIVETSNNKEKLL